MYTPSSYAVSSLTVLVTILAAVQSKPVSSVTEAEAYLSRYGYFTAAAFNNDSMEEAIKQFQRFSGLDITGKLDKKTLELMSTPRCGVSDKLAYGKANRAKRYALQGSRWINNSISYHINNYPTSTDLSPHQVVSIIGRAFGMWSSVGNLIFNLEPSRAVISISFKAGDHGDGYPFDGPGGTLGHGFYPNFGGVIDFDDAENWTNGPNGINLLHVAAHEIGHALGLAHSDKPGALMGPFYRGYDPTFNLTNDDIQAIQTLYGKNNS